MELVFINGEFVKPNDAKISVFDRGFLFGDSIYEVIPIHNNKVLFADKHMQRLQSSLSKVNIPFPNYNYTEIFQRLIENNSGGDTQIYIQISRGDQGARKYDVAPGLKPTVIIYLMHSPYATTAQKELGFSAITLEDIRWSRCDIKTNSLIANILLNEQALAAGFDTTILLRDGIVTESAAANIFIVTPENQVKTPLLNDYCLPGVTRQIILELMREYQWSYAECAINLHDLEQAQEIWITGTTREIYPITKLNETIVGNGRAGAYWKKIDALFQPLKG